MMSIFSDKVREIAGQLSLLRYRFISYAVSLFHRSDLTRIYILKHYLLGISVRDTVYVIKVKENAPDRTFI